MGKNSREKKSGTKIDSFIPEIHVERMNRKAVDHDEEQRVVHHQRDDDDDDDHIAPQLFQVFFLMMSVGVEVIQPLMIEPLVRKDLMHHQQETLLLVIMKDDHHAFVCQERNAAHHSVHTPESDLRECRVMSGEDDDMSCEEIK